MNYHCDIDGQDYEVPGPVITSNYLLSLVNKNDEDHKLILVLKDDRPVYRFYGDHEPILLSAGGQSFETYPYEE